MFQPGNGFNRNITANSALIGTAIYFCRHFL